MPLVRPDGTRIVIQTALNGSEKRVGKYLVDGYAVIDNEHHFWEFNGCIFHDCICLGLAEECDRDKVNYLESVGTLHIMRMCVWNNMRKKELSLFEPENICLRTKVTEADILNAVKNGTFYGFLSLSVQIPPEIASKFDWLNISYLFGKHRGSEGKDRLMFCESVNGDLLFRFKLFFAPKNIIFLLSPLVKYYMEMGAHVSDLRYAIAYQKGKPFMEFADKVGELFFSIY